MLSTYGWGETLRHDFEPYAADGLQPARVIVQQRGLYRLVTETGEVDAKVSGRFVHEAMEGSFPVVGDWVAVGLGGDGGNVIHAVLPRASAFVRRAAGPPRRGAGGPAARAGGGGPRRG
ncbi:MAG: hypothetical protein ABW360_05360, partial [Phenylobacterium sp.]